MEKFASDQIRERLGHQKTSKNNSNISIPLLQVNSSCLDSEYDTDNVFSDSSKPGTPKIHDQSSFFRTPKCSGRRHSELKLNALSNSSLNNISKPRANSSASSVGSNKSNCSDENYALSQEVLFRIEAIESNYKSKKLCEYLKKLDKHTNVMYQIDFV